jgi:outer membrane murein-binding lipoprotein Lpp
MTTKNLTSDQKLDLIIEKVSTLDSKVNSLDSKVSTLDSKVNSLTITVNLIDTNVKEIIQTLAETTMLAGETADRVTKLETKKKFTPFTSGAFVA